MLNLCVDKHFQNIFLHRDLNEKLLSTMIVIYGGKKVGGGWGILFI